MTCPSHAIPPPALAQGVSEMACVAGDKLVISMIMQLTSQGLECTQVSQLGTKVCEAPGPRATAGHSARPRPMQSRTLPPSSPIVETQKSGSAVQFLLQSAQSASVTLHIAGPGFNIVEDRSLKEGDQDTLVQKLVLQKPGEDALVTTRYFLRQHKPPPPPPETAGRAAV